MSEKKRDFEIVIKHEDEKRLIDDDITFAWAIHQYTGETLDDRDIVEAKRLIMELPSDLVKYYAVHGLGLSGKEVREYNEDQIDHIKSMLETIKSDVGCNVQLTPKHATFLQAIVSFLKKEKLN